MHPGGFIDTLPTWRQEIPQRNNSPIQADIPTRTFSGLCL
jgi:hypothetical protein